MRGAAAAAAAPQRFFPTLRRTPTREKGYLNFKMNAVFAFCLFLAVASGGNCLVLSRSASLQPTAAATHGEHPPKHHTPHHTPEQPHEHASESASEMEEHWTESSSKSEAAAPEHNKGAESHEGAAGEKHLQQQKPESAAASAPSAEPSGAPSAKASAAPSAERPAEPSAAAEAAEGTIESAEAEIERISKQPYEEGMGKMFTEGQHIVQMLQEGLRASRALKAAAKISAKLRGEIVKDVEALKDTLHKEHQNLTLLRKYEQEQDALLKAQLGYLTPLNNETKEGAAEQTTATETAQVSAVRGAYTSQATQSMGVSAAVSFACLLLTLGLYMSV